MQLLHKSRARGFCLFFGGLLCFTACGSSEEKTNESPSEVRASDTTVAPPSEGEVRDAQFLVASCLSEGMNERECQCLASEAQAQLSSAVLGKLEDAPMDDDIAMASYYTVAETGQLVNFLRIMAEKCEIQ